MAKVLNSLRTLGDVVVGNNLIVNGTTTSVDSEIVNIADNFLYLNSGYTTNATETGGIVVNSFPTSTVDTVAAGGFTAVTTVATTAVTVFAAGDIIQISGTDETGNNGIFEVASHAANVLTIKALPLLDFVQNLFTVDIDSPGGDITKITVSVLSANTGTWQAASGDSSSGFTYDDILTTGSIGGVSHSALSGLVASDDHTQYALLAGRSGGQTLSGGSVGSEDLTLRSNSVDNEGAVRITGTDVASSIATGALVVSGGVGIATALWVGTSVNSTNYNSDGVSVNSMTIGDDMTGALQSIFIGQNLGDSGDSGDAGVIIGSDVNRTRFNGSIVYDGPMAEEITDEANLNVTITAFNQLNGSTRFTNVGNVTYTLPDSATGSAFMGNSGDGVKLTFINSAATGTKTIAVGGTTTIDGLSSIVLTSQYERITLVYSSADDRYYSF